MARGRRGATTVTGTWPRFSTGCDRLAMLFLASRTLGGYGENSATPIFLPGGSHVQPANTSGTAVGGAGGRSRRPPLRLPVALLKLYRPAEGTPGPGRRRVVSDMVLPE